MIFKKNGAYAVLLLYMCRLGEERRGKGLWQKRVIFYAFAKIQPFFFALLPKM